MRTAPERLESFPDALAMVIELKPHEPVYCLYPNVLDKLAQRFIEGFPGTVLYAVKASAHHQMLTGLHAAAVHNFDVASVPEMELVRAHAPGSGCYFMAPIRLQGAVSKAFSEFGVRHFVVDHINQLDNVLRQTHAREITFFVRMASHDPDAMYNLSTKFGATPGESLKLLRAVFDSGATPAIDMLTMLSVRDLLFALHLSSGLLDK